MITKNVEISLIRKIVKKKLAIKKPGIAVFEINADLTKKYQLIFFSLYSSLDSDLFGSNFQSDLK